MESICAIGVYSLVRADLQNNKPDERNDLRIHLQSWEHVMCEANAYLIKGEENQLIMEAVDTVEPEKDGIRLMNIFGDQKFLKARIHSLFLVDRKIFLEDRSSQA
jgi:predicted RNA-binding protein